MINYSAIKLIVLDMDGTLLDDKKQIDTEIFPLLNHLKERHILLTLASGRNIHIMKTYVEQISITLPVIANNGATLYLNNKCIYKKNMLADELTYALSLLSEKNIPYVAYGNEGVYILGEDKRIQFLLNRLLGKTNIYKVTLLSDIIVHNIFKVVIANEDTTYMSKVLSTINTHCKHLRIFRSEGSLYTLTHTLVTKGETLKQILEMYNIRSEEVLAFGDNYNDVSLFRNVGISVAMNNAVDEVKREANFITKSNNEHGVSFFIKEYLLLD